MVATSRRDPETGKNPERLFRCWLQARDPALDERDLLGRERGFPRRRHLFSRDAFRSLDFMQEVALARRLRVDELERGTQNYLAAEAALPYATAGFVACGLLRGCNGYATSSILGPRHRDRGTTCLTRSLRLISTM